MAEAVMRAKADWEEDDNSPKAIHDKVTSFHCGKKELVYYLGN